ncbi:MAG: hypothetical protein JWM20_838 [Patescibacteria group bacterium]|nr:hypothetical protein [Patescibacteria group bacterium]
MEIQLVKFGNTSVFRDRGREAFTAFEPELKNFSDSEELILDFSGILTFAPSWGDEFLSPLVSKYGDRLILKNTSNSSVKATLDILEKTRNIKFNVAS